jgi:hypothetical protein
MMGPVQILGGDRHELRLRTRMPFRYGITEMTVVPQLFLRLRVRVGNREGVGIAADLLPPKWFTKDPAQAIESEVAQMRTVIAHALGSAIGVQGPSVFAVSRAVARAQSGWGAERGLAPLLTQFGTSFVERALIDAVCRAHGRRFIDLLLEEEFGFSLGDIHGELAGQRVGGLLPELAAWCGAAGASARAGATLIVRHTVGLSDPIAVADVPCGGRLEDGLPQALDACIARYGLRHFKIKITGDLGRDVERLERILRLLQAQAPADHAFSLDGNEQFRCAAAFRGYWESLVRVPGFRAAQERCLFVEQPIHRDAALEPAVGAEFAAWSDRPRLVIDESDALDGSYPAALACGYDGTSHKNCKGIWKGIANACLTRHRQANGRGRRLVMTGEDLCNVGPVALQQDLLLMAALGITSVERNGHHYHAGLSQFPPEMQRRALERHPDLYERGPAGWPTLRICEGRLALGSVLEAPFGVGFDVDLAGMDATADA